MNEMRMDLNLKPGDTFTKDMIDKIKVNTPGIKEVLSNIKDKDQFVKVMNTFYGGTGITIGTKNWLDE